MKFFTSATLVIVFLTSLLALSASGYILMGTAQAKAPLEQILGFNRIGSLLLFVILVVNLIILLFQVWVLRTIVELIRKLSDK